MKERNANRSHARMVFECKMAIKKCDEKGGDIVKTLSRFGKATREQALYEIKEEHAQKLGMTMEEYEEWLKSDD